jgi:hypothetical protein
LSQIITSLLENRNELESIVTELKVDNQEVELAVFDIISHSLSQYHQKLHRELDEFFDLLKENFTLQDNKIITQDYKLRSSLINWKNNYGHAPAYIFVINYNENDEKHLTHIYNPSYSRTCVKENVLDNKMIPELEKLSYEDNATLVDKKGTIIATETQLVNVDPSKIIGETLDKENFHLKLGFQQRVHSRHSSAIGASYHLNGTVVYTLSETGMIRRFANGKITFSTVKEEKITIG